jgi:hypothetical protein
MLVHLYISEFKVNYAIKVQNNEEYFYPFPENLNWKRMLCLYDNKLWKFYRVPKLKEQVKS